MQLYHADRPDLMISIIRCIRTTKLNKKYFSTCCGMRVLPGQDFQRLKNFNRCPFSLKTNRLEKKWHIRREWYISI